MSTRLLLVAALAAGGTGACGGANAQTDRDWADAPVPLEGEPGVPPESSAESEQEPSTSESEPEPTLLTPDDYYLEAQTWTEAPCPENVCEDYVGNYTECQCDGEGRLRVMIAWFDDGGALEERYRYHDEGRWDTVGVRTTYDGGVMWASFERGTEALVEESWTDYGADGVRDSHLLSVRTDTGDGSWTVRSTNDWSADGSIDSCETAQFSDGRLVVREYDEGCDESVDQTFRYADCPAPFERCVPIGHDVGIGPDDFEGDWVLDNVFGLPSSDPTDYGLPRSLTSGEALPGNPARPCYVSSAQCANPDTLDCRCGPDDLVYVRVILPDEWSYEDSYIRYRYDAEGRVVLVQSDMGPQFVDSVTRRFYDREGRIAATVTATDYGPMSIELREFDGDVVFRRRSWNLGEDIVAVQTWVRDDGGNVIRMETDEGDDGTIDWTREYVRDENGAVVETIEVYTEYADYPTHCVYYEPQTGPVESLPEPDDCY